MATVTKRASPVKVILPPSPWFVQNPSTDEAQRASDTAHETRFKFKQPGFGSRHIYDDAPFTLWDAAKSEYRNLLDGEAQWISERYKARRVLLNLPDIFIQTSSPPDPIPLTVAAAVVRFYPLDITMHTTIPQGKFYPYGTTTREDVLGYTLPLYATPTDTQCLEVIGKLKQEMSIRSVQFLPPAIIVEIHADDGRQYERKSLPAKAGGLNIMYHHSGEAFWKGQSQLSYARLTTPSHHVNDDSDYLRQTPFQLSPGVCLSSAAGPGDDFCQSTWKSTTAGVMVQRGPERRLTAANHGFGASREVFHPSPSGRRIGEIVNRWPAWDLAFVAIDPSISFNNGRYFSAPPPARLISPQELLAGDWFELDGISTGRIDMMARGRTYDHHHHDTTNQTSVSVNYAEWDVSTLYSAFGPMGGKIQEGVCGAPVVDVDGRVAGFFRFLDDSGMWASTASLESLIRQGWSIV
jgi:hypothetical protein